MAAMPRGSEPPPELAPTRVGCADPTPSPWGEGRNFAACELLFSRPKRAQPRGLAIEEAAPNLDPRRPDARNHSLDRRGLRAIEASPPSANAMRACSETGRAGLDRPLLAAARGPRGAPAWRSRRGHVPPSQ